MRVLDLTGVATGSVHGPVHADLVLSRLVRPQLDALADCLTDLSGGLSPAAAGLHVGAGGLAAPPRDGGSCEHPAGAELFWRDTHRAPCWTMTVRA